MKDYILDLDRPRELKFGFKAMRTIRLKFGENKTLTQLLNLKVDEMPYLAYAALKWDDKNLTPEKVEDLIDEKIPKKYTILKVMEIISNALIDQMGVDPKVKASIPIVKMEEVVKEAKKEEKKKPTAVIPSTKKQKK